ncbi:MAG: hypothetical protein OMM_09953 [Candidatus Magnetoglobus multicellularis str. Araruama]|uniref:STAS domain-containing protein n=1 Tax=Candidatus Magnetoglobus multicellularis str. Araruama TaxID=890399 RepID=A0A1V1P2H5_9BACT|nr:MAG: hypothetical protein OMM_09953 [Candidatus Magnetoglobus multicellularis str. Araruama]
MNIYTKDNVHVFDLENDLLEDESITFQNKIKSCLKTGQTRFCFKMDRVNNIDPAALCALMTLARNLGENIDIQGIEDKKEMALIMKFWDY